MFKKLVSNLPYSPSLLPQVSFYVQRLRQENIVRKVGVGFAILTLVVQSAFIFFSPAPSIASDANDLIRGGLRHSGGQNMSESEARRYLTDNVYGSSGQPGLQELFEFYGISEQDIRNARETYICSKEEPNSSRGCDDSDDRNLRSIGRERNSKEPGADVRVQVPGRSETFYHRPLHIWDSDSARASRYKALSIDNGRIYILYSCANIVFRESPETAITTSKSILSPTDGDVNPGEHMTFRLSVKNSGNSPAYNVVLADRLNPNLRAFTPVPDNGTVLKHNGDQQRVEWSIGTLGPDQQATRTVQVYVRDDADDPIICNRSDAHFVRPDGQSDTEHSEPVACIDLEVPSEPIQPYTRPVNAPEETPKPYVRPEPQDQPTPFCSSLVADTASVELTVPVTVVFEPDYEAHDYNAENFTYYVNDQTVQDGPDEILAWRFNETNGYTVQLSIEFSDGTTTDRDECDAHLTTLETPNERIDQSKSARIVTDYDPITVDDSDPRAVDAHDTTVKANDIIEYRLLIQNSGNTTVENYEIPQERLADILEYADVIDANAHRVSDLERYEQPIDVLGGGKLEEGVVRWNPEDEFTPGEQIEKLFFVQIKDPIPQTNQVASNPLRYDCQIDNTYSNTISIYVDCPFQKQIEQSVNSLPNTGPTDVMPLLLSIGATSAYLYQRNKLLSKELSLVKKEYTGGV